MLYCWVYSYYRYAYSRITEFTSKLYLKQKAYIESEQKHFFLTNMPYNASYQVTESTLYFEDGSKRIIYRRDECKKLNTPDKKRVIKSHGEIREYDKDGNHITTNIFMS